MKEFFTRELHNKAQKAALTTPDGEKTDKYLMFVGTDSDHCRKAKSELRREANIMDMNTDELTSALVACCIVDGNLGGKFSNEKVRELFSNAPYIRDQLDSASSDHSNFLAKKSKA